MLWLTKLNIAKTWIKMEDEEITLKDGAELIAEDIKNQLIPDKSLNEEDKQVLEDIIEDFKKVGTVQLFDNIMEELYNWGDQFINNNKRKCFVNCFDIDY